MVEDLQERSNVETCRKPGGIVTSKFLDFCGKRMFKHDLDIVVFDNSDAMLIVRGFSRAKRLESMLFD
jgi:hypothetical protein